MKWFPHKTTTADNKAKAGECGAIEVILEAMKTHMNNAGVCEKGCGTLWNTSFGCSPIQKQVCEKGGLDVLLKVLKKHYDNENVLESCCGVIGTVLSSPETHSRFCTDDVLRAVRECSERHKDNKKILQFFLSITREEDPRVTDAVARGVCTKEVFPKCSDDCGSDINVYCPECCVQQKVFRCHTCDKGEVKIYCEACWKKNHQGHECEEFFCPARCATKTK